MNPNFFPPNPYRNSFGNNGPDESPARSPLMGGGHNSYRPFVTSPPYRPHGPPRPCGPGHFARQPHPYGWNSESSSPLSANSPSRGGFLPFSTNAVSPRYRSPAEVSFDKTTSSPYQYQSGNGNRGGYRPGRGYNRFSNSGHLSWSGTPSGTPSYNMAGIKRQSSGFNRVSKELLSNHL